jgi:DNA topoisomerase-1
MRREGERCLVAIHRQKVLRLSRQPDFSVRNPSPVCQYPKNLFRLGSACALHQTINSVSNTDPTVRNVHDARAAGLRYVSSLTTGIRRIRRRRGFAYVSSRGKPIRNKVVLRRIASLVIPPAWKDVLISPDPRGHIQAIGHDQRGRKQYKYHLRWREVRDESKYEKLIDFGRALPKIRRQVRRDLKLPGLPREKVLATVVKLLECSHIRVGNEEYARQNHSFGLTTMRNRHVRVNGSKIRLRFRGKTGIEHDVNVENPRLAKIVRACQHLPGQELFQYLDDDAVSHPIESTDVNEYLQRIAGDEFTAKDFRTWNGTVLAAKALKQIGNFDSEKQAKTNVIRAVESVAKELGNTKAVCRKCYIHPAIVEAYFKGTPLSSARHVASVRGLGSDEAAVVSLLKKAVASGQ